MGVKIINSEVPLTEEDIKEAEQNIKRSIPEEYHQFLLKYNGGTPEPMHFKLVTQDGCTETYAVERFFSLKSSYGSNLEWRVKEYTGRMPSELFPVAGIGGCLICIASEGINKGKVYLWHSEFEPEPETQPNYENVYFIAENFDLFLKSFFA